MKGVEKLLLFLRGYPEISHTNGGIKSAIYVGTIQLLTLCIQCNFCWCLITSSPTTLVIKNNDTNMVSPVTIWPASFCIFCKVLESCCVLPSHTYDAYSMGSK